MTNLDNFNSDDEGTKINWARVAVRDDHGSIDVDATMTLCRTELENHISDNEVDISEIEEAVDKVFDKLSRGGTALKASIDMGGLQQRACSF